LSFVLRNRKFLLYNKYATCEVIPSSGKAAMSDKAHHKAHQYAARLNSFKNGVNADGRSLGVLDLLERAATVPGLNAVDLNYPDHVDGLELRQLKTRLADLDPRTGAAAHRN
jgi:hypothetical protein